MYGIFFTFLGFVMISLVNRMEKLSPILKKLALSGILPLFICSSSPFFNADINNPKLIVFCFAIFSFSFLILNFFSKYENFIIFILSIVCIGFFVLYFQVFDERIYIYITLFSSIILLLLDYWKWNHSFHILQLFLLGLVVISILSINIPDIVYDSRFELSLLLYFLPLYECIVQWKSEENKNNLRYKKLDEEFEDELRREIKIRTWSIERHNMALRESNKLDKMTQAYNKNASLSIVKSLIDDIHSSEFSLLMFDIDKFKSVNDTYGHVVGDKCIKFLAKTSISTIRDHDYLGRFGGDEFMIILPGLGTKEAFLVAERLRKEIEDKSNPNFTISIGIASYPNDGENLKTLLEASDKALYISKENGRNKISHIDQF